MNIYEKLTLVQSQLKAPKGQFNKFGNFNYRSLEDIVEGVKPLLLQHQLTLILSDNVKQVGDRFYIETTATLINGENPDERIITTALAREANEKKGMDSSQLTGATSSYARKYCLNGLFNIDDTKEADAQNQNQQNTVIQTTKAAKYNGNSNNNNIKSSVQHQPQSKIQGLSQSQLEWLQSYCQKKGYINAESKKEFMHFYGFNPKTTTSDEFVEIQKRIEADETVNVQ